jgi:hypothetical protein
MYSDDGSRIQLEGVFDAIVIGGGVAGTVAAIAAARLGSKVALVQDRPSLGGNSSNEIRVPVTGADAFVLNRNARETGILEEMILEDHHRNPRLYSSCGRPCPAWDWILWEWVHKEPNLSLYLNARARHAVMASPNSIAGIIVEQTSTERTFRLDGSVFVDASGDGQIAVEAGAEYRFGREARDEYDELYAPLEADTNVLSPTLLFTSQDVGEPASFVAPPWARDFVADDDIPYRLHGKPRWGYWWISYGGTRNPIAESEEIRDELIRVVFGVWDHLKNHGDHGAENRVLSWVGTVLAKRESRRFLGDHVLCQSDVESQRLFPDRVAYGGWPIDLHPPSAIDSPGVPGLLPLMPAYPWGTIHKWDVQDPDSDLPDYLPPLRGVFSIPLRSLYSRTIENLFFAGRNISATHVAFGATRVQATCAVMGQAVGTAASLCTRYGVTPRAVYENHIHELQQQLLKDDCYIVGLKNEDAADVARGSKVKASSEAVLEVLEADRFVPLDVPRGQMFCGANGPIDTVALLLESTREDDVEIEAQLLAAQSLDDFQTAQVVGSAKAVVPGQSEGWVDFDFGRSLVPETPYWIKLPTVEGVAWGAVGPVERWSVGDEPLGAQRGQWYDEFGLMERVRATHCFKVTPGLRPYGAQNVINGVSRPEAGANLWMSDPRGGFPQWIELTLPCPQEIDTICLTFDTNLDRVPRGNHAPECVRDYRLLVDDGTQYKEVARVSGNYHRRRIHRFDPMSASRVRLIVEATNGVKEARVYEIRIYRESR